MELTVLSRLGRAAFGAAVSTLVACGSHVLGGGDSPALAGLLVPLLLSFAVCVQFAGRALSLWRLGLAVTLSQGLFHLLFVLGSGDTTLSSSGHGHHVGEITATVGHAAGHGAHGAHGDHGALAMTLAHLGAAVVTTAALHHGEWLLTRGALLLTWLGTALFAPRARPVPPVRPVRTLVVSARVPARTLDDVTHGILTVRGPPVSR